MSLSLYRIEMATTMWASELSCERMWPLQRELSINVIRRKYSSEWIRLWNVYSYRDPMIWDFTWLRIASKAIHAWEDPRYRHNIRAILYCTAAHLVRSLDSIKTSQQVRNRHQRTGGSRRQSIYIINIINIDIINIFNIFNI